MKMLGGLKIIALVTIAIASISSMAKTAEEWAKELGYNDNASYDATRVMETKEGKFSAKVRHAPGKESMEVNMGGMQSTVIMRRDLGKSYAIMPTMGMYREMELNEAEEQSSQNMNFDSVEKVGTENIDGFDTTKYKAKFKDKDGKGAGFMWITEEGVLIKMDMIYASRGMKGMRMKMHLQDLVMRYQQAKYFEIPEGVQPMNMSAMMRMAQQQQGQSANQQPQNNDEQYERPSLTEEVGDAAQDEARNGVVNETRDAVRKGLRGLFKR